MIKGLSNYEKYKVLRPIIGASQLDEFGFPVLSKEEYHEEDWNDIDATCIQNINGKRNNKNTLLFMFNYDYKLHSLWNNPLKKVGTFTGYFAIATPDFSIYPGMNINEIRHNIYKSRWLGKTWQNLSCKVFPTIAWGTPDTYDMCFSGIEKHSIVVVSTVGCQENKDFFLQGFNEMKKRITPSLIIVYGDMIKGMTGKFVNFTYKDAFNRKNKQLRLPSISQVFEIKENQNHGI